MISEEEINQARHDLVRYGNEWKKRKRACMEILDMICESADLNRKEFMVIPKGRNPIVEKVINRDR